MIKLIVSDIDGTLVKDGENQINPEIFDVIMAVSYTHLRAHETAANLVCRLLL